MEQAPHILLIEDNPGDVRLVELMLEEPDVNSFRLTSTNSLSNAISCLSKDHYDAILLDMDLPDGQGMENVDQISSYKPDIPIVIMTGQENEQFALLTVKSGVQDYLVKGSIDKQQLTRSLSYAIERKTLEDEMRFQAHHDQLTGLVNRSLFQERLDRALIRCNRRKESIAVLYLDLDNFKSVNDGLGHNLGDKLLVSVSNRLSNTVRESDTVARLGGDEFAIILDEIVSTQSAAAVAEKIIKAISSPFEIDGNVIHTGTSIGVAIFPESGKTAEALIKNADSAMYRAKRNGRKQYQVYENKMNAKARNALKLENDLHKALDNDEFLLHYQPKVCLESGGVTGMEALLRWQHPTQGLIYPLEFIPLLEENGMITHVGEWVLNTACEQRKCWQDDGLCTGPIAVNLSGRQLARKDLGDSIANILENTGLEPNLLEVELTETMLVQNTETSAEIINYLRSLGVSIAIDDFGTGYSSLTYLREFMFDTLKIDRSFISNITNNSTDAAITSAVVGLSRDLNINVVAEGVETKAQMDFLRNQQTNEVQGFYISPPLPGETFISKYG